MTNPPKSIMKQGKTQSMGLQHEQYRPTPSKSEVIKPGDRPIFPDWDQSLMGEAKMIASNRGYINNKSYESYVYKKMKMQENRATMKAVSGDKTSLGSYYKNMGRVINTQGYRNIYGLADGAQSPTLPHKIEVGDMVTNNSIGEIGILQDKQIQGDTTVLIFQDRRVPVNSFENGWNIIVQDDSMATTGGGQPPIGATSAQTNALFKEQVDEGKKVNPDLKEINDKKVKNGTDKLKKDIMSLADSYTKPVAQTGSTNFMKSQATSLQHSPDFGGHKGFSNTMSEVIAKHKIPPGSRIAIRGPSGVFHGKTLESKGPGTPSIKGVSGKHPLKHYENYQKGSSTVHKELSFPHGKYKMSYTPPGQTPKEKALRMDKSSRINKNTDDTEHHVDLMTHLSNVHNKREEALKANAKATPEDHAIHTTNTKNLESFKKNWKGQNKSPVEHSPTGYQDLTNKGLTDIMKKRGDKTPSPNFKSSEEKSKWGEGVMKAGSTGKDQAIRSSTSAAHKAGNIVPLVSGKESASFDLSNPKHVTQLGKMNPTVKIHIKNKEGSMQKIGESSFNDLHTGFENARKFAEKKGMDFGSHSITMHGNLAGIKKSEGGNDYKNILSSHKEKGMKSMVSANAKMPIGFAKKTGGMQERKTPKARGLPNTYAGSFTDLNQGNTRTTKISNESGLVKGATDSGMDKGTKISGYNRERFKAHGREAQPKKEKKVSKLPDELTLKGADTEKGMESAVKGLAKDLNKTKKK